MVDRGLGIEGTGPAARLLYLRVAQVVECHFEVLALEQRGVDEAQRRRIAAAGIGVAGDVYEAGVGGQVEAIALELIHLVDGVILQKVDALDLFPVLSSGPGAHDHVGHAVHSGPPCEEDGRIGRHQLALVQLEV